MPEVPAVPGEPLAAGPRRRDSPPDRRAHGGPPAAPTGKAEPRGGDSGPAAPPAVGTAPRHRPLVDEVEAAFTGGGPLAAALPSFEPRAGQREMASAAAGVFEDGGVLLAEAGTGTGKTLAYLVPAILSGHRVLVSTGTKQLQDQIFDKDLPALRGALGVDFTATYMKGRANYLCLHRFEAYRDGDPLGLARDRGRVDAIAAWAARTATGDRAELEDLPDDLPFWGEISAASETCIGTECPQHAECFVTRMRQRAAESDLVIVNHHLLCADAAVRQSAYGEVIPSYAHAVIDEAHQLEDVATQYFGVSVSNYRLERLVGDGRRWTGRDLAEDAEAAQTLYRALDDIDQRAARFLAAVRLLLAAHWIVEDVSAPCRIDVGPLAAHLLLKVARRLHAATCSWRNLSTSAAKAASTSASSSSGSRPFASISALA